MDKNMYLGPYVRVTVEVVEQTVDLCGNHNFPEDADFCPKCGTKKESRIKTQTVEKEPEGWHENYPEGLFYDFLYSTWGSPKKFKRGEQEFRTYLYLPNRYHKELEIPEIKGFDKEISFEEIDFSAMLKKFEQRFEKELKYLKECGFEVETKCGFVAYCS